MRKRLRRAQNLGRNTRTHAGMAIGSVQGSPSGLSWLVESQHWEPSSQYGGLSMDPVTFGRLVEFLKTHSHTGMGSAENPMTRDVDGINALARETAYDQAANEVIGPRSPLFSLEGY